MNSGALAFFYSFLFLGCFNSQAQIYPFDTIMYSGEPGLRYAIAFISDGYTESEMDKYIADAKRLTEQLFSQSPFKEYKSYFNVAAIKVPSRESGADHSQTSPDTRCLEVPKAVVDNYFDTQFDNFFIHRLLIPQRLDSVYNVMLRSYPYAVKIVILVNTPYYGGSGGYFVTLSPGAEDLLPHELGHGFGNLADEYWAGEQFAEELANMTQQSNPQYVKWKNWLNVNEVGIYPHAESPNWFRPHQACKMRQLMAPFCSVCQDALVEEIHSLFGSWVVEKIEPLPNTTYPPENDLEFKITTIKPDPNTMKIVWKLNGEKIGRNIEKIIIPAEQISDGYFKKVTVEVLDTTHFARSDFHATGHLITYQWNIDGAIVTSVTENEIKFETQVWPNPTNDRLNFMFKLKIPQTVSIKLIDESGKEIERVRNQHCLPGEHVFTLNLPRPGFYFVVANFGGTIVTNKVFRR